MYMLFGQVTDKVTQATLIHGSQLFQKDDPAAGYLENETAYPVTVNEDGDMIEITAVNDLIPEISTTATVDDEKEVCATEVFTLTDTVEYTHLVPGKEYTVKGILIEALANKVDITERYLYRIENEGKKPSFDVLHKLVRELNISADSIFYPEKPSKDSEVENLLRMLSACDERSLEVVKATAKALIDTAPEK